MELKELRNTIDRYAQIYFYGGEVGIADSVYDGLIAELKAKCPTDPRLTRVGAPIPSDFAGKKVKHKHPMGSLEKAFNLDDLREWAAKQEARWSSNGPGDEIRYNLSFKEDGASVALYYQDGYLVCAATRGKDGTVGQDVTANALRMRDVPHYVELPPLPNAGTQRPEWETSRQFTGSVRGECLLYNEDWKRLDPDLLSNPRNLGNGMVQRLDGDETEYLCFRAFRLFNGVGRAVNVTMHNGIETESGMLMDLVSMGFKTVPYVCGCTMELIEDLYNYMNGDKPAAEIPWLANGSGVCWPTRDTVDHEIDGLVIKVESMLYQSNVDGENRNPESMIALKFPARIAETELLELEVTLGHTGVLIPNAILKPVRVGGVTVTHATLHNWPNIKALGIAVGDIVKVERRGDVIPAVVGLAKKGENRKEIIEPTVCPFTGSQVKRRINVDGKPGVHIYSGVDSPEVKARKILKWTSSHRILGIGDVYVRTLYDAGIVMTPADVYRIPGELYHKTCAAIGAGNVANLIKEIEGARNLKLSAFLGALGIDGLGSRRVDLVRGKMPGQFDTMEDWISGKLVVNAKEVGLPNAAKGIQTQIIENLPLILALRQHVNIIMDISKPEVISEGSLCFCLTGTFPHEKEWYHTKIINCGHRYVDSFKKGVSFVVAADPHRITGKVKKAQEKGIPVIGEAELLAMLEKKS